jgi:hypothetical protein
MTPHCCPPRFVAGLAIASASQLWLPPPSELSEPAPWLMLRHRLGSGSMHACPSPPNPPMPLLLTGIVRPPSSTHFLLLCARRPPLPHPYMLAIIVPTPALLPTTLPTSSVAHASIHSSPSSPLIDLPPCWGTVSPCSSSSRSGPTALPPCHLALIPHLPRFKGDYDQL